MRVVLLGKDKPVVIKGLEYLVQKNIDVVTVVGKAGLVDVAKRHGIPAASRVSDLKVIPEDIDLVISLLYWEKVGKPLLDLPRIGCVNFHPAPLPDFRGLGGYNFAILENLASWGATAHFMDEEIDTGEIIKVQKFDIDPEQETAYSLERKTQPVLLQLFEEVIDMALDSGSLTGTSQAEGGRYITFEEFEKARKIGHEDSLELIERKIRAFWFPPYGGAYIKMQGEEFTLLNGRMLDEIGKKYRADSDIFTED